jgi:hypothetical protein
MITQPAQSHILVMWWVVFSGDLHYVTVQQHVVNAALGALAQCIVYNCMLSIH